MRLWRVSCVNLAKEPSKKVAMSRVISSRKARFAARSSRRGPTLSRNIARTSLLKASEVVASIVPFVQRDRKGQARQMWRLPLSILANCPACRGATASAPARPDCERRRAGANFRASVSFSTPSSHEGTNCRLPQRPTVSARGGEIAGRKRRVRLRPTDILPPSRPPSKNCASDRKTGRIVSTSHRHCGSRPSLPTPADHMVVSSPDTLRAPAGAAQ